LAQTLKIGANGFYDFDLVPFLEIGVKVKNFLGLSRLLKERKNCKFTPVKNSQNI